MTNSLLSRRAAFAQAGSASVVLLASGIFPAKAIVEHVDASTNWNSAFAEFERLHREYLALDAYHDALTEQLDAALASVPHTTLSRAIAGSSNPASTRDRTLVATARRWVADVADRKATWPLTRDRETDASFSVCCELVAADDLRNKEIEKISSSLGHPVIEERLEALTEAVYDARQRLFELPAPGARELLWKLEHLLVEDAPICLAASSQTRADARRLLNREAR